MHLPFIHSCLSSPLASGAFIFILCPLSPSWIYWITQPISSQQPPYQDIFNSVAENRKQWLAGCFSVVTFGLQIKRLLQQQLIWSSPWKYKTLRTYSCYFWLKITVHSDLGEHFTEWSTLIQDKPAKSFLSWARAHIAFSNFLHNHLSSVCGTLEMSSNQSMCCEL